MPFANPSGKTTDANGVPVAGVSFYINDSFWFKSPSGSWDWRTIYNTGVSDANGNYNLVVVKGMDDKEITPPAGSGFSTIILSSLDLQADRLLNVILPATDNTNPLILCGPIVTKINNNSALVTWRTNEPTSSELNYGEGALLNNTVTQAAFTTEHSALLTGLTAETLHSVKVKATDKAGNGPVESAVVTFTTTAIPDTSAPFILEGPIVTCITHNSAVVEWTTNEMTTSLVDYGLGVTLTLSETDATLVKHHRITLTGLTPDTLYTARASSTDAVGNGPVVSPEVPFTTLDTPDVSAPLIISGPMVIDITEHEATIIWKTNEPATSGVSYNDGTLHGVVRDEALVTSHAVRLTGLTPLHQLFPISR